METSRQIEHAAAAWIARRDSDSWSDDDQRALDSWISHSIAHRVAFIRLDAAWQQSDRLKVLGAGQTAGRVPAKGELMQSPFSGQRNGNRQSVPGMPAQREKSEANGGLVDLRDLPMRRRVEQKRSPALRLAAVAATLVIAGTLALGWTSWTRVDAATYATSVGDLNTVSLADGSNAILNTDSKLKVALSRRERDIELERGEAFFKVAKDASRPFVVKVGDRKVVAVGTQFSVRRDADGLRVVVTEGIVRLEMASTPLAEQVHLQAGSIATLNAAGLSVKSGSVDAAINFLSWRNGYLVFADTTLADAASEFNRYNKSRIVIGDAAVAQMRVDGNFRYANVDAFVRLLEQAFPLRAERSGDEIVLKSL